MKVNNKLIESVDSRSGIAQIIACALYMNAKSGSENCTVHGQVASLGFTGVSLERIAKKTGFDKDTVLSAIADIFAFVGR